MKNIILDYKVIWFTYNIIPIYHEVAHIPVYTMMMKPSHCVLVSYCRCNSISALLELPTSMLYKQIS